MTLPAYCLSFLYPINHSPPTLKHFLPSPCLIHAVLPSPTPSFKVQLLVHF